MCICTYILYVCMYAYACIKIQKVLLFYLKVLFGFLSHKLCCVFGLQLYLLYLYMYIRVKQSVHLQRSVYVVEVLLMYSTIKQSTKVTRTKHKTIEIQKQKANQKKKKISFSSEISKSELVNGDRNCFWQPTLNSKMLKMSINNAGQGIANITNTSKQRAQLQTVFLLYIVYIHYNSIYGTKQNCVYKNVLREAYPELG